MQKHDKTMKFYENLSTFDQKVTIVPNPLYVGSFQPPRRALGEQKSVQNRTKWVQKWQKCRKAMNYYCFWSLSGVPKGPLGLPRRASAGALGGRRRVGGGIYRRRRRVGGVSLAGAGGLVAASIVGAGVLVAASIAGGGGLVGASKVGAGGLEAYS